MEKYQLKNVWLFVHFVTTFSNPTKLWKKDLTVERIAQGIGISKNILYDLIESDPESSGTLERLNDVRKNNPFEKVTDEDTSVNSMMICAPLV